MANRLPVRNQPLEGRRSELAVSAVSSALRCGGLSSYRNDSDVSIGRHLRDVLSAPIMINNDRILANGAPRRCWPRFPRHQGLGMSLEKKINGKSAGELEALKAALFRPTGVDGVYARTGLYEGVVEALGGADLHLSADRGRGAAVPRR